MAEALHWWTIAELSRALEERALSPVEATKTLLERIEALDGRLHAYVSVRGEAALAEAAERETELLAGRRRGPLHGVPVAVKDLCDVAGEATTAGTRVLRDRIASRDATVVQRLRDAGAVVLGRLAMTEGAFTTHHESVTPPVNPWNPERWTGISSSGSGVAVAAGLCFGALGTDTGGSIRFPSACCGVVGLKPTHGRVPLDGVFPLASSLDHVGPMARSVGDVALLFEAIAGGDPRDPTSRWAPVPRAVDCAPRAAGVRIGVDREWCAAGGDAELVSAVLAATEVLAAAGAEIRDVSMPAVEPAVAAWPLLCAAEVADAHRETFPARADEYGPALRRLLELGHGLPARALAAPWRARMGFAAALERVFADVDAVLCPALALALPAGIDLGSADVPPETVAVTRFTGPFNLTGHPSLTLPCGLDRDGAPIGLQLVAPPLQEERLLRLGAAYEAAGGGLARHPGGLD